MKEEPPPAMREEVREAACRRMNEPEKLLVNESVPAEGGGGGEW